MRLIRLSSLFLLILTGNLSGQEVTNKDIWQPFAGALRNTQSRNLTSEITGQTYQISVALPDDYATSNKTYPVLYAVGATAMFGTVVETARGLRSPELIIIGIGYSRTNRRFNLTPTEDNEFLPERSSGGGPGFLEFLRRELIPFVELEFRADSEDRGFYGHSLGGLFALYALLEGEGTFKRVIASSPSLGWDNKVIYQIESAYANSHDSLAAELFLSIGMLENDEKWGESPSNVKELVSTLEARQYNGLQINTTYFENETHMSVAPAAISRGLRAIYGRLPTSVSE